MRKFNARTLLLVAAFSILLITLFYFIERVLIKPEEQKVEILPDNCYEKTILAVADIDYEPFSFIDENGNLSGYDVELLYALANEMSVNIEIRLMNWAECKAAIEIGEADIITGLDYQPDSTPNILLSRAVVNDSFVCFGKENLANINTLYYKKIATIEQSGCFQNFLEPYRLVENTTVYSTYTEAIQSVILGENDYAIALYSVGRRILAKLGETRVRAVGPSFVNNSVCIGVNYNKPELLEALNEAIARLTLDGTIKNLSEEWLGTYVELISFNDFLRVYDSMVFMFVICLILLITLLIFFIYRVKIKTIHAEQSQKLKEKELELVNARVDIMLSQIQPHFLYNALATIENVARRDTEKAGELISNFSQYLRVNMNSLKQKEMIPFEQEVKHIAIYLSFEKMRFKDRLHIFFYFETLDFNLPVLTAQPLVENAVRHGMANKREGVTLNIYTKEVSGGVEIIIDDDGAGFDPSKIAGDGHTHIGLENVRSRLETQCGGTLSIKSNIGVGTTVVIFIPVGRSGLHEGDSGR